MRKIKYNSAIREAIFQLLEKDKSVFLIGQGVKSPWYAGGTTDGLVKKFTETRVIDTPVSENAVTGAAVGAAILGMRPILMHPRMDFMMFAMDPIINEAANWSYMTGGKESVPLVIWSIINRGGEQAAQHSQALQAIFCHIPGLKVVSPSNAYDAKGLLISSVYNGNPVIFVDDRWLYSQESEVPEEIYQVPIGKAEIKTTGNDLTIISYSYTLNQCLKAAKDSGLSCEVIDLKTLKPWDKETVFASVRKTKKALIVESAWQSFGIGAEVAASISENTGAKIKRLGLKDVPAPASSALEKEFYLSEEKILKAIKEI